MAAKPEKLTLEQLLRLVHQLPAKEQEELRVKLNRMAKSPPSSVGEPRPFLESHIDIDLLAQQQGLPEQTPVESLKGGFCPDDEDMDEFVTTLRQWRKETSGEK